MALSSDYGLLLEISLDQDVVLVHFAIIVSGLLLADFEDVFEVEDVIVD